jgi:hypothetical protein
MVEKDFNLASFVNAEKLKKVREKKSSINSLNNHEKQVLAYGHTFYMLSYNTVQGNIYSYYLIKFDDSKMLDIFKVNIDKRGLDGYFLHSVSAMNDKHKELKMMYIIQEIIKGHSQLFEYEEMGYSEHDDIAYVINPLRNDEKYFQ